MSKSRHKPAKKAWISSVPPSSLLRPKLDRLWGQPDYASSDRQTIIADLDNATRGIKPHEFLGAMLKASQACSPEAKNRLDEVIPLWLSDRNYIEALTLMVSDLTLGNNEQAITKLWLEAAGVDSATLAALTIEDFTDSFYGAYTLIDDLGSQGVVIVFWYPNKRRNRLRGFSFLVDYNPPWEGATKDITYFPSRSPQDAIPMFVDIWTRRGLNMKPISAEIAKQKIVTSLLRNRDQEIRLPLDLIQCRTEFSQYILTLPNGLDTPAFSIEDFDSLSQTGKKPETISAFEQNVGRKVRMEDGQELFIGGDSFFSEIFDEQ